MCFCQEQAGGGVSRSALPDMVGLGEEGDPPVSLLLSLSGDGGSLWSLVCAAAAADVEEEAARKAESHRDKCFSFPGCSAPCSGLSTQEIS